MAPMFYSFSIGSKGKFRCVLAREAVMCPHSFCLGMLSIFLLSCLGCLCKRFSLVLLCFDVVVSYILFIKFGYCEKKKKEKRNARS